MPRIIKPCEQYLESYLEACKEYKKLNLSSGSFHDPEQYDEWKSVIFDKYDCETKGINLPKGCVPSTTYWLVDDDKYIGSGNIRHELTDCLKQFGGHIGYCIRPECWNKGYGTAQLKMLLQEANKLGIGNALLTCDAKNIASARVMEKNGAKKLGLFQLRFDNKLKFFYKYEISTQG